MRWIIPIVLAGSFACGSNAAPSESPTPSPDPAAVPEGAGCAADADCVVTFLPATAMTKPEECCMPLCARRVEARKKADELQAAYGATCAAVSCPVQECAKQEDPVPACRAGQCVAGP
jgi:hypothetical protein